MRSQCSGYLEPCREKRCAAFAFTLSHCFQHSCFCYIFPSLLLPLPFFLVFLFPLLSQCDGCLDVPVWGLIAGSQALLVTGAFYCLGAGWSQWRPLDIGHPPSTQLDTVVNSWYTIMTLQFIWQSTGCKNYILKHCQVWISTGLE